MIHFQHRYLRTLREKAGLSVLDLQARFVREGQTVSEQTIRNWETKSVPGLHLFLVLLKILGMDRTPARHLLGMFFEGDPDAIG